MSAPCLQRPRILQATRCRLGLARPQCLRALPLPSLRSTLCRSAATEALSFEELLAAGEASTPSPPARPQRPQPPPPQQPSARQQPQQQQPAAQRQQQQQQDPEAQAAELESHSLKIKPGDTVLGRVVGATPKGAKVVLLDGSDLVAYMPVKEGPFHMREADEEDVWAKSAKENEACLPAGLVREFRVVAIQHSNAPGARSGQPLLSAREVDLDLMWRRAMQVMQVCLEGKENIRLKIDGANSGGLTSRLTGLNIFVPVSQLEKREGGEWWSEETMAAVFLGKELSMAVLEVARKNRKVVASLTRAKENDALRALEVGSLVTGSVRRVEPFGAFVGIDGSRESGLIHISNISRVRIQNPHDVFKVGERVKCVLMGMDPDFSNISLSTAELEVEEGDIMRNRQAVWDNAEEQAELFQQHLRRLTESGFDFEAYYKEAAN